MPVHEFEVLWAQAQRVLAAPGLARFFDSSEYVRAENEVSFVQENDAVSRIDRLVEFRDEIWLLDYKTATRMRSIANCSTTTAAR